MTEKGLVTEDWLVVHCEPLRRVEESEQLDSFDDLNEKMLRYLCIMDDHPTETGDPESENKTELHKLQLKTDLALNLLGEILWGQLRLTPPKWVRMSAREIFWRDSISLPVGQLVKLQIYPRRNFPIKLSFYARILPTELVDDGSVLLGAEICEPSESLTYWLEKYIFQQHRRKVARHSGQSSQG